MILQIFFLILSAVTFTESLYEGDYCILEDGRSFGVCTRLNNCQPAIEKLMSGRAPKGICGYTGFDPIVCCARNTSSNDTSSSLAKSRGSARSDPGSVGFIAKQKCMEYAKLVYVLTYPPMITVGHKVNISQCGIRPPSYTENPRLATYTEMPYIAAIGYNSKNSDISWHCSGALISETFVLTAAHCANSSQWGNATWVRFGISDLSGQQNGRESSLEDRRIVERIMYPEYKPPSQYHDIALLRLESRVTFNRWIRPACLHTAPSTWTVKAITSRWGDPTDDSTNSTSLLLSMLYVIDTQTCIANWTSDRVDIKLPNGVIDDWSICAGNIREDSCQGDSGSPLTILDDKEFCMHSVVGIQSLGDSCKGPKPGLYSRVYRYLPWIESTVWGQGNS